MPRTPGRTSLLGRLPAPSLGLAVEAGLLLRVAAADLVEWRVRRGGGNRVCLLPDAEGYWKLAQTIRDGEIFQIVEWGDIPHFALRTPGYPLFLAACRTVLGDRPLGARLVQAGLGAACVWLVYRLTRSVIDGEAGRRTAVVAAMLTAVHPYFVIMSALLLSEAVFTPLLLAFLWALAVLWKRGDVRSSLAPGLGAGLAAGAATLTRPSCVLFFPAAMGAWAVHQAVARRAVRPAAVGVLVAAAGFAAVMGPWWVRNQRVYGEFVPTALWMGASLYDGLNPNATGASDMRFLKDPDVWPLGEQDQDALLKRRAFAFVRDQPARAAWLALVKLGRYWSPWPNAEGVRSLWLTVAAGLTMTPLLALTALGLWTLRRDPRTWVLLAGPILYFGMVHAAFASSMRYRTPGEVPAMGLAAVGILRVGDRASRRAATG
ncbi:glycosyltransferase family 39 protein [Paludisphaera mucosa]|uniref:Glycosyltransferase family 39 protein n=1 Tax=Paludisphaera mucosa TaxID=3030827 RepID=A0ABT6FET4_9BACT|nr:glycosyltransferase family 39 protein [Paludisphaera mucosa]MDG3006044.1 glycosyltransferase family 39 protein [Paludisphaera mucosa]